MLKRLNFKYGLVLVILIITILLLIFIIEYYDKYLSTHHNIDKANSNMVYIVFPVDNIKISRALIFDGKELFTGSFLHYYDNNGHSQTISKTELTLYPSKNNKIRDRNILMLNKEIEKWDKETDISSIDYSIKDNSVKIIIKYKNNKKEYYYYDIISDFDVGKTRVSFSL